MRRHKVVKSKAPNSKTETLIMHKANGMDIKVIINLLHNIYRRTIPAYSTKTSKLGKRLHKLIEVKSEIEIVRSMLEEELFKSFLEERDAEEECELFHIYYGCPSEIREIEALNRLRQMVYFEEKWIPTFLKLFIKSSKLRRVIEKQRPQEILNYLEVWVESVINEIEDKRKLLYECGGE